MPTPVPVVKSIHISKPYRKTPTEYKLFKSQYLTYSRTLRKSRPRVEELEGKSYKLTHLGALCQEKPRNLLQFP